MAAIASSIQPKSAALAVMGDTPKDVKQNAENSHADVKDRIDLSNSESEIVFSFPEDFNCPITCEVMIDPVITADGHTYERKAIEDWFSRQKNGTVTNPMTNEPLENAKLIPNIALRSVIEHYKKVNPIFEKAMCNKQIISDAQLAKILNEREQIFAKHTSLEAAVAEIKRERETLILKLRKQDEETLRKEKELLAAKSVMAEKIDLDRFIDEMANIVRETTSRPEAADRFYQLGIAYSKYQDKKLAIKSFDLAFSYGNVDALYMLGVCYDNNKEIANSKLAHNYYSQAATKRHPLGLFIMGLHYEMGNNGKKDLNEAYASYTLALEAVCDDKHPSEYCRKNKSFFTAAIRHRIGFCYQNGVGVAKDDMVAQGYYEAALLEGGADVQNQSQLILLFNGQLNQTDYRSSSEPKATVLANGNGGICRIFFYKRQKQS